ncbi:E3 ubiquitin-protein ligase znrf2 [Callorhinchus milii]|uniref:E3 ubiquitin-protein ligase znrf2 n=1 Tax=Callorhinchus milii TaxID=7868 RepID=UPI001C3F4F0C|nr:E3 ubiquitin-protein ligase znrf2 [Callorhinchus milii]
MGAKQSSPATANGRTRAYSGSDLPSSSRSGGSGAAAASSSSSSAAVVTGGPLGGAARYHLPSPGSPGPPGRGSGSGSPGQALGSRTRSMGANSRTQSLNQSLHIPGGAHSPRESDSSAAPEDSSGDRAAHGGPRLLIGSLPAHLSPHLFGGFKCPVCSKFVSTDEMDLHLVMCLTKPRVTYNEDVLSKDTGECAICLEELQQGDTIARLPCLCIYHKGCIDSWFEVNRSCPEHPSD